MTKTSIKFNKESNIKCNDSVHRAKIEYNIGKYDDAVLKGYNRFSDYETARNHASTIKTEIIENLEDNLEKFISNATLNGFHVFYAENVKSVQSYISEIINERKIKLAVKSKSMVTEETEINHLLESLGCESVETDLGEFIVQTANERPYHILTPAMHKSKEDISVLFHEKFRTPLDYSPEQLTGFARKHLREKFVRAELGISGANFLLRDEGGICLTENEGNAFLAVTLPKVHIVIAGFEKIISNK